MPRATVNGIELYYEERSVSPYWLAPRTPVLFIHGLSTDHTIWSQQVASFEPERAAITLDLRGHGRSAKPAGDVYAIADYAADVAALLRQLGGTPIHIVAVSMGGMIAQQLALREPELVRSLSLVCTSCEPPSEANLEWRLKIFDESATLEGYYGAVYQRALAPDVRPEVRDYLYQLSIHNVRPIQRTSMIATFSYSACEAARAIRAPTLVIGAAHDGSIPAGLSNKLADNIPNARVAIIPNCGHAPYVEVPAALNRELHAFIDAID